MLLEQERGRGVGKEGLTVVTTAFLAADDGFASFAFLAVDLVFDAGAAGVDAPYTLWRWGCEDWLHAQESGGEDGD